MQQTVATTLKLHIPVYNRPFLPHYNCTYQYATDRCYHIISAPSSIQQTVSTTL